MSEPSKKTKILIVDDNETFRQMYAQVFAQRGFEVTEAVDGAEGFDLATKNTPDVILTGIIMPKMNGFQLITALRENVQTQKVPIAILSHYGREEDRKKAKDMGIEEFIVQGMATPNEIVEKMKNLLKKGGSFRISFDPYAWDAQRLALTLPNGSFSCPNCQGKMILEMTAKSDKVGFDAVLKCPKCDYAI